MSDPWQAEHPVGADLAETLVRAQFPELLTEPLQPAGEGWDNEVWRSGELAFRFPRRALGAELLASEARVLPALAPRLPLPVPATLHVGEPSAAFPHLFVVHRYLGGTTGDRAALGEEERQRVAPALGAFLAELHAFDVGEARGLGVADDVRRGQVARRCSLATTHLPKLEGTHVRAGLPRVAERLSCPPPDAPPEGAPGGRVVLVHGDLYARHLLFDERRRLCGVIDWGDVCLGDPAIDLCVAWTLLPARTRPAFWSAYGEVDAATRRRAAALALTYPVLLAAYALDVHDGPLLEESARSLAFVLQDDEWSPRA